ncbi:MAG TPA: hypothetical protein VFB56_03850 [Nitrospiraceae bacterium]|nr:hypothetical protein [Nitrospiraceae bacterium]
MGEQSIQAQTVTRDRRRQGHGDDFGRWMSGTVFSVLLIGVLVSGSPTVLAPLAIASHQGHEHTVGAGTHERTGTGYPVPGVSFQVFLDQGEKAAEGGGLDQTQADAAVQTVIDAFTFMLQHRTDYPRFDESVKKDLLQHIIIEPHVVNQDGKEFAFLVARTKDPGRVNLLISASSLKDKGYLGHSDKLVSVLAREFQWVVSKADTAPKSKATSAERDLKHAPIRTDHEILALSGDERAQVIQRLFDTYLRTVDDQKSLEGQPFYDVGTTALAPPAQPDSATKLYDIRVREALQRIVRDPYFVEHTPKAVRSLLNGKIWNVSFVKIDQRDWATRTRVTPEDKAVSVGQRDHTIQPANILVNTYRTAAPDDPFYADTKGLPMGALSADELARVIALEIQHNIIEKSMRGHVAQDELTAPR